MTTIKTKLTSSIKNEKTGAEIHLSREDFIDDKLVNHQKEVMKVNEKLVIESLIELGWTPPKEEINNDQADSDNNI